MGALIYLFPKLHLWYWREGKNAVMKQFIYSKSFTGNWLTSTFQSACNYFFIKSIIMQISLGFRKAVRKVVNPFHVTGPLPYALKTSENQRFSDVFRAYRRGPAAWNGLIPSYILSYLSKVNTLNFKKKRFGKIFPQHKK